MCPTIRNIIQFKRLNESIGADIDAKLKKFPHIDVTHKGNCFTIQYGKKYQIGKYKFNTCRQYECFISFKRENDLYYIDSLHFYKCTKNTMYKALRSKQVLKKHGKYLLDWLTVSGIKLHALSEAKLKQDTKARDRILEAYLNE